LVKVTKSNMVWSYWFRPNNPLPKILWLKTFLKLWL